MINRATFLKTIGLGSLFAPFANTNAMAFSDPRIDESKPFPMHFAPHLGMFEAHAGKDPIDQLQFMVDQGFTAFEDNELKNRPVEIQEKMASFMQKHEMKMGVFVAHTIQWRQPDLVSNNADNRTRFLSEIQESVDVAKRINASWMTVVPGHIDLRRSMDYQTANAVETLKYAAEILEPHDLIIVLEPLNFRDHPGQFLSRSPQAYQICKAVNSPSVKILFDIYHQQIQEGNLIPNIDHCWDEIAYFQIGDNPGRNEPGTGEINYSNVFKHIQTKGYSGILGMEHGNSLSDKKGELAVIQAYKRLFN